MAVDRPTFSESWYRVAALKVKLRAGAQISRQFYRGDRWYVVRDPARPRNLPVHDRHLFTASALTLLVLSLVVLLITPRLVRGIERPDAAQAIVDAIEAVLTEGPRTPDLGGTASTSDLGKAIAEDLHPAINSDSVCDGADACRKAVRTQIRRGANISARDPIDELLSSPDYADFFAGKWSAVLKNRRDDGRYGEGCRGATGSAACSGLTSTLFSNEPTSLLKVANVPSMRLRRVSTLTSR